MVVEIANCRRFERAVQQKMLQEATKRRATRRRTHPQRSGNGSPGRPAPQCQKKFLVILGVCVLTGKSLANPPVSAAVRAAALGRQNVIEQRLGSHVVVGTELMHFGAQRKFGTHNAHARANEWVSVGRSAGERARVAGEWSARERTFTLRCEWTKTYRECVCHLR